MTDSPRRGTEKRMDEATEKAIESAAARAATKAADQAVEHALVAFRDVVKEEVGAAKRELGVQIEVVRKEVSAIADGFERTSERLDGHDKRIERLEDHAGLPTLEPAVE